MSDMRIYPFLHNEKKHFVFLIKILTFINTWWYNCSYTIMPHEWLIRVVKRVITTCQLHICSTPTDLLWLYLLKKRIQQQKEEKICIPTCRCNIIHRRWQNSNWSKKFAWLHSQKYDWQGLKGPKHLFDKVTFFQEMSWKEAHFTTNRNWNWLLLTTFERA